MFREWVAVPHEDRLPLVTMGKQTPIDLSIWHAALQDSARWSDEWAALTLCLCAPAFHPGKEDNWGSSEEMQGD